MKDEVWSEKLKSLLSNKYALALLGTGLALLLVFPSGEKGKTDPEISEEPTAPTFSLKEEESRLEKQLSSIKGAGKVSVLLSVEGSVRREPAQNGQELLVISRDGEERVVDLYYVNPAYTGAVIVCQGAGSSRTRMEILAATSVFTGLGTDRIEVIQME